MSERISAKHHLNALERWSTEQIDWPLAGLLRSLRLIIKFWQKNILITMSTCYLRSTR